MGLSRHVNPFLGVDSPGNCLPGPCLPLGVVRLGPDMGFPQETHGYASDGAVLRFSHTHVAGTGGCSRYGNVGITPFAGAPDLAPLPPFLMVPAPRSAPAWKDEEAASAGHYAVRLMPMDIRAELTCTRHVGVHRYRYPKGQKAWILLDAGAAIQNHKSCGTRVSALEFWDSPQRSIGGYIELCGEHEAVGRCDLRGGWGHDQPYCVHFCLQSSRPIREAVLSSAGGLLPGEGVGRTVDGRDCRAALGFGVAEEIELRVGISFVSVANARAHLADEAEGRDFATLRSAAAAAWDEVLGAIAVRGGSEEERAIFYSLFCRLMTMPTDLGTDVENPRWRSGVRHFWDFYCLWDSIRNANSLVGLVFPELHRDIVNCLLDIAERTGWLADAWISGHHAYQQSGCFCDVLIREAHAKGLAGIDYRRALELLRRNAEAPTPDPHRMGRYPEWEALGHLPEGVPNCLSRSIEYSYLDWCLGKLAEALGEGEVAARYLRSSQRLWGLWDDGRQTFIPKDREGRQVAAFDPERMRGDCWNDPFVYEALGRSWTLCAFHDFAGLIRRFGGAEAFVRHLDEHFAKGWFSVKETKMHTPYLYIYAGRPDRAADRVRESMLGSYANTRRGLHDNEDMGCQSAYYMCGAIGLYPVMGQPLWLLVPPRFDEVTLRLGETGGTLRISVRREGEGRYIRAATLNGAALDRAWLRHAEIAGGAELCLDLGDEPGEWGTRDLPPLA